MLRFETSVDRPLDQRGDIAMAGRTIARDPRFLVKVYEVFAILFGLAVLAYVLSLGMSPN
jgi:hypothetical protein